jgi:hypothetical protein
MKPEILLLKEIIHTIENIYGNSAYFQYLDYAAKDGKDNWLSKARKLISDNGNKRV